jgi:hypothetical protein
MRIFDVRAYLDSMTRQREQAGFDRQRRVRSGALATCELIAQHCSRLTADKLDQ